MSQDKMIDQVINQVYKLLIKFRRSMEKTEIYHKIYNSQWEKSWLYVIGQTTFDSRLKVYDILNETILYQLGDDIQQQFIKEI